MGKTSRKLNIIVVAPLHEWPEIVKLREQGHNIVEQEAQLMSISELQEADIILGPNCWLMTPAHKKYLPLALKAARLKRYGKPQKRKGKDEEPDSDDLD